MEPVQIKEGVYWVGSVDWDMRDFHGYSTHKGTTYNAFLVMDEKVTLFDTVKENFAADHLRRISCVTDPEKIDYIIVSHVELDHSGSLPRILELAKPEKIFCSPMAKQALLEHFHRADWPYEVVKSGDTLKIGRRTIQFLESRMLHWPDSMVSLIKEDRLLVSNDIFGQHWATSERFDDEVDSSEVLAHAAKYYANILLPYSGKVVSFLGQISEPDFQFDIIATDHGLIWRSGTKKILAAYDDWSRHVAKRKAVVIYDTMWESTKSMAHAVSEGLIEEGLSVQIMDLRANARDDVMTEVLESKAVILGSSTLHNGILPRMADMISYMKGLRPRAKIGASFGSYGWSGEAVKILNHALEEMKIEILDPGIRVKYVPTSRDLEQCEELGRKIGKAVKQQT